MVVDEFRPEKGEQLNPGPIWEHKSEGLRNVILDPHLEFSIATGDHVRLEAPHFHPVLAEGYNFHGPTTIWVVKLEVGALVEVRQFSGGYVYYPANGYCHWTKSNEGGWDNFRFRPHPPDPFPGGNNPPDKITCSACPFHGQCALEEAYRADQSLGHQDSQES